jgi:hypothetical protein
VTEVGIATEAANDPQGGQVGGGEQMPTRNR